MCVGDRDNKEASQSRGYCAAKNAAHRVARPDPSLRKEALARDDNSLRRLEAISGATHGFKIARILRVRLDLFADATNIDINGAWRYIRRVAPHGVKKVIPAEDAAFVASKIIE